jgi:hypothetical protein
VSMRPCGGGDAERAWHGGSRGPVYSGVVLMLPLGGDSKSRVLNIGKHNFPHEGDSRVYIKLSGNCVYKDSSCPSSNNLQSK